MMKRASLLVTDFMLFVILVIADQLTKHLAVVRLKNQAAYNLINGILEFNYLENRTSFLYFPVKWFNMEKSVNLWRGVRCRI